MGNIYYTRFCVCSCVYLVGITTYCFRILWNLSTPGIRARQLPLAIVLYSQQPKKQFVVSILQNPGDRTIVKAKKKGIPGDRQMQKLSKSLKAPVLHIDTRKTPVFPILIVLTWNFLKSDFSTRDWATVFHRSIVDILPPPGRWERL